MIAADTWRRAVRAATVVAAALVLAGCPVGSPTGGDTTPGVTAPSPEDSGPTTTQPNLTPPEPPPPSEAPDVEALEQLLDHGGLTDEEVGFPREQDNPGSRGLDAPTQDQCDPPDETDQQRIARVQRSWSTDGFQTLEPPVIAVSSEIVVYEAGAAEAALAALAEVVTECPTKKTDRATQTFGAATAPEYAIPGSVALTSTIIEDADGVQLDGLIVAQAAGDVVAYVYVIGQGEIVGETANHIVQLMAERVQTISAEAAAYLGSTTAS